MRNPLRVIEEKPLITTMVVSGCGFFLGAFADTVAEQWIAKNITTSAAATLMMVGTLLLLLMMMSMVGIDLMVKLNRKVGIKVRYYESDPSGAVYVACQKVVARATKSIDVVNSYLVEAHDPTGSARASEERRKYYATLLDRAMKHNVKYRRIVQVRDDRSNLEQMQDDPIHEAHLRTMLDRARGPREGLISLMECSPSRVTTFVLVDGSNLIWQINEVKSDASGKERLHLQGAFIFHDPQNRITEHFARYFDKLLTSHKGALKLQPVTYAKPRRKRGVDKNRLGGRSDELKE